MSRDGGGAPPRGRRDLIRGALLWTPLFVGFSALAVNFLVRAVDGSGGAWVSFILTALVALLGGYSALAALRDLFAEPIETEGPILRKWAKTDLFFFRGRHLLVEGRVFRLRKEIYAAMPEEGARVYLRHYPHTNALIDWYEVPEPEPVLPPLTAERDAAASATTAEAVRPPHFDPPNDAPGGGP